MPIHSLHIALNKVDADSYGSGFPKLSGCLNDAAAMRTLVERRGAASVTSLLGPEATTANVLGALSTLATQLTGDDLMVVSYSGHGSQMPGDASEPDGKDETWVLYDRQLLDDELWSAWARFPAGCRVLVVSDSCTSGTVLRLDRIEALQPPDAPVEMPPGVVSRRWPWSKQRHDFERRRELYDQVRRSTPDPDGVEVNASLLLFAACQDGETAGERDGRGIFTAALCDVWSDASVGSYQDLFGLAAARVADLTSGQTPNYLPLGVENLAFERSAPLS